MSTAPALPPPGARRPLRPLLLLAAVVLLAHAWLLRAVTLGAGDDTRQAGVRRLEARRIEVPAPVPAPVAAAAPAAAAPAPAPAPRPSPRSRAAAPAEAPAAPTRPTTEAPAPEAPAVAVADAAPAAEAPASAASAPLAAEVPAEAASAGGGSVPVYATRIPAPALLRYDLKRGGVSVTGSLTWRHDGQRYELGLEGSLFGLTVVEQFSQGGFDSAGLAPLRFADRRRGRDLRAANFQRDAGKITFSGPQVEYPLVGGAQDRLSWLVQLPAIAAAAPQALVDGARISIFVVGSRGEGDVWTFGVVGRETLDLARGATEAVHLLREPRREYDSRVEVWLAPALDFWPVRARLATPAAVNETTELTLQDGPMPP